jgi:hypothetical protein
MQSGDITSLAAPSAPARLPSTGLTSTLSMSPAVTRYSSGIVLLSPEGPQGGFPPSRLSQAGGPNDGKQAGLLHSPDLIPAHSYAHHHQDHAGPLQSLTPAAASSMGGGSKADSASQFQEPPSLSSPPEPSFSVMPHKRSQHDTPGPNTTADTSPPVHKSPWESSTYNPGSPASPTHRASGDGNELPRTGATSPPSRADSGLLALPCGPVSHALVPLPEEGDLTQQQGTSVVGSGGGGRHAPGLQAPPSPRPFQSRAGAGVSEWLPTHQAALMWGPAQLHAHVTCTSLPAQMWPEWVACQALLCLPAVPLPVARVAVFPRQQQQPVL